MSATASDGRVELGRRGEDAAAAYLERTGMRIEERNWRCKAGEIDIVAREGTTLVLVEVKTRKGIGKGSPEDAVTPAKQRRIARLAATYLNASDEPAQDVRFDVITLLVLAHDRALLRHHRAAFAVTD